MSAIQIVLIIAAYIFIGLVIITAAEECKEDGEPGRSDSSIGAIFFVWPLFLAVCLAVWVGSEIGKALRR